MMGKKVVSLCVTLCCLLGCCACRHASDKEIAISATANTTTTVNITTTTVSARTTTLQTTSTTRKPTTSRKNTPASTTTTATQAPKTTTSTAQCKKSSHLIQNVPLICQFPAFPSGCESVASVMALQCAGEKVSVSRFIDNYLNTGAVYRKDGVLYGPDPYKSFVGDPRSQYALGCYAPVIENALIRYLGDATRVKNTTGDSLDTLCERYIAHNIPALVWVSIYMKDTGKGNVWYTQDGKRFQWITNEHCMLLVGYDENGYYFNDPYSGKQLYYDKTVSTRRYETFGKQSLVILR